MQHDFGNSTEGTIENGTREPSGDPIVAQIVAALNEGDHETAGNLLHDALEKSPEDQRLLRLAAKQRRQAERFTRVYSLIKETREAIDGDEFVRAVGAFREAANLSQGFRGLEEATFQVGVDEAEKLGDRNWRIARTLLEDAGRIHAKLVVPEASWTEVRAAEREETIASVLEETATAKPADLGRARERLQRTLEQYPEDAGLADRLKSIESTIEEKRKWDERQRCLKKLTDWRDSLQQEVDPAAADKYLPQAEAIAGAYIAEPEFSSVVDDLRHQVISCEKAVTALKQDRIEDCLEECAWVLSRMRHHQLFLNLKKEAEEREISLADEYSSSISHIKELLATGHLAEAETLCTKASAQLPQFADLQELKKEIEQRRNKEDRNQQEHADHLRRLLERGERSLREHQYKAAEQAFGGALKLAPEDRKVSGHLVALLHGYARAAMRENAQTADDVLQLTERILPGTPVPADLAEPLRQQREKAKEESVRWAALDKIGTLNAQVETARTREDIASVREEADKGHYASASHADVREAGAALFEKMDGKVAEIDRKQARRPVIYRTVSIAATLLLGAGLAYWMNNRPGAPEPEKPKVVETAAVAKPAAAVPASAPVAAAEPVVSNSGSLVIHSEVPGVQVAIGGKEYTVSDEPLKVELNADSYQVKGSHPGYKDFGPVTVAVGKSGETVLDLKMTPKPASVEIRATDPDTRIRFDGVLLGKARVRKGLTKEVPPGEHSIEVARKGFQTKTLTRTLGPGEVLVLSKRDLQLESSDARTLASVKAPAGGPTGKPEDAQWQALDKSNPDALRAFVSKYPDSPWAGQAKQQMDTVLMARAAKAEDSDWSSADHNNRAALEDFLKRHPNGQHAAAATSALADIDRKARAAELQNADEQAWKKVNQHDEASLEAYLRESPAGRYRNQAEVSLSAIHMSRTSANESAAVLTVISRLASAWSAKDLDSILAIQRNLNKRVVKAELAQVKELDMRISPASPPQIDGTQAVVLCRRRASQVFSDGTRKQIPESIVSYVLTKRDGNWTIEATK